MGGDERRSLGACPWRLAPCCFPWLPFLLPGHCGVSRSTLSPPPPHDAQNSMNSRNHQPKADFLLGRALVTASLCQETAQKDCHPRGRCPWQADRACLLGCGCPFSEFHWRAPALLLTGRVFRCSLLSHPGDLPLR